MKSNKLGLFFRDNIFYIIICIVGIGYIFSGVSQIVKSGETIDAIISAGALTTILGFLISKLFGQSAIKSAYNDTDFINALNSQSKIIEEIDGDIDKLDLYCERENELSMIRKRTRILKRVGIKLEQFNSNNYGNLIMTKQRKKAINKAYNIGYGYLTSDWLLADLDFEEEKNSKQISIKKYIFKQDVMNMITKILTGVIGGYYVLEPFVNANWNIIIWRVFFFTIMLIFGYVRYIGDYNFITHDYRQMIITKTNYLIKFKKSLIDNKQWYIVEDVIKQEIKIEEVITEEDEEDIKSYGFGTLLKKS
ncbi:MAG: hypothetical protein EOL97_14315 [Spirochaetia bacterium]|nr:hypothetical protein [Spirochaetia bacterium]